MGHLLIVPSNQPSCHKGTTSPFLRLGRLHLPKAFTSASLSMLADIIAQRLSGEKYDIRRTLRYGSFSFHVSAPLYHFWYIFVDKLFQGRNGKLVVLLQLLIDQAIFSPIFFIIFYVYMAVLQNTFSKVGEQIKKEVIPVSLDSAKVWVPVQFITFKFVPPHLRVLWNNLINLGWNIYFSLRNSKKTEEKSD